MGRFSKWVFASLSIGIWLLSGCVAGPGSAGTAVPVEQGGGGGAGGSGGSSGSGGDQMGDGVDGGGDTSTNGNDASGDDTSTNGNDASTDGGDPDTGGDDGSELAGPGVILSVTNPAPAVGELIFLTCVVTEPGGSPATSFEFFSTATGAEIIQDGSATASAVMPPGFFTIDYQCRAQTPAGAGPLSPIVIVSVGG